ncbi:MAG: protein kinase [Actinobacteria bacterium]|nr:protein kinase [Actinomycetota bacterium]
MRTPAPATLADGRYELVRRIGRGASGEVWLARDTVLGREVAIKRADIPDYLGTAEQDRIRRRLEREARAAARLRRPGVAPLFDVHVGEDSVDLVMAYIDAPTLHQLVADEGPLPDAEVAAMGLTILSVLEEAHAQGVVHRDIKPSNVLVSDEGARVTDFGIAAILDETALTRTGMAMGSPSYIAPEQAKGEDPAPTADLWGLGATLYYALTGRAPFERQRAIATVHAVVNEPHEPIDGSHPLAALVDRLLAKDPADRPAVHEIRTELERVAGRAGALARDAPDDTRVLAPAPTVVSTPAGPERPGPPTDRQAPPPDPRPAPPTPGPWGRRLAVLAGVLLLGLVAFAVASSWDTAPGADGVAVDDPGTEAQSDPTAAPEERDADRGGDPAGGPADDGLSAEPTADLTEDVPVDPDVTAADGDGSEASEDGAVPDGWTRYDGETYSVAVPAGWEVRDASGPRTDLVDPSGGAYLRVDWTDEPKPDPEADWREQSQAFASRHDDYRELRIASVDYQDAAAIWEYTYRDGGADLHAYNLGFVAGGRGYALNLQSHASDWDEVEPLFDDMMASFRPAS